MSSLPTRKSYPMRSSITPVPLSLKCKRLSNRHNLYPTNSSRFVHAREYSTSRISSLTHPLQHTSTCTNPALTPCRHGLRVILLVLRPTGATIGLILGTRRHKRCQRLRRPFFETRRRWQRRPRSYHGSGKGQQRLHRFSRGRRRLQRRRRGSGTQSCHQPSRSRRDRLFRVLVAV